MKIAIHDSGKGSFSERWISYCKENNIDYKIVNAYNTNIVLELEDCDAFMWHHHHALYKDVLFARQLLYSLQISGKKVFPDFNTCWHFDDKLGQKYLLEAINAPLIPSYVFFTKEEAMDWIEHTTFPKVFKLRGGAGSENVKLVKTKGIALALINRAFGKGFKPFIPLSRSKEYWRKYRLNKSTLRDVLRPLYYIVNCPSSIKMRHVEKGYIYFQDFIPNNTSDIRIVVVGDKAFGIKRMSRKNDFRASGSGNIIYNKIEIDERCVKIAFEIFDKIRSQCIAFDFVFDGNNIPFIIEISYGFSASGYEACEGYWDKEMNWHEGPFNPCVWMIENLIK